MAVAIRPPGPLAADVSHPEGSLQGTDRTSRNLVLLCLVAVCTVRLFTEKFTVLPGVANFIDVPIVALLVVYALVVPASARARPRRPPDYLVPLGAFTLLWVVSTVVNQERVQALPALLFLYGFVSPLVVYLVVYRIWPVGSSRAMSRTILALAALQFVIVALIDLPRFLARGRNPDLISGTFGVNPYQLVFFLLVFGGVLTGVVAFERRGLARRFWLPIAFATALVIFLAQYRALLLATGLAVVLLAYMVSRVRGRGPLIAAASLLATVLVFSYVVTSLDFLKFGEAVGAIRESPGALLTARFSAAGDILDLYEENLRFGVTGTGPGSYSSRAWRTFASEAGSGNPDVASILARQLTGGGYRTDVSDRYVIPALRSGAIFGSVVLNSPFSSWWALAAETGLAGLIIFLAVYVTAFLRMRRASLWLTKRAKSGDSLPGILLGATVAFFTLLQMAFLENWLEVTRITFIAWILFAVGTKELRARIYPASNG